MKNRIPPPVWLLLFGGIMWFVAKSAYGFSVAIPFALVFALAIGAVGVVFSIAGIREFNKASTTVNPLKPEEATTLVTTGIFQRTRNPMYVGLLLILTGWAVWLSSLSNLLVVVAFVIVMTELQIKPEEAVLRDLFGDEYAEYCQRVRRWI